MIRLKQFIRHLHFPIFQDRVNVILWRVDYMCVAVMVIIDGLFFYIRLLMEEKENEVSGESEETFALTAELVADLTELLANKNPEVQHGTISAILQYTPTPQSRSMFSPAAVIPLLRKYLFVPKLTTISLSALIHFAGEAEFLPEYFPLVEPLGLKLKEWKGLELELSLLLLLNISKEEEVLARVIGEGDKRGYLVEVLYALLQNSPALRWIIGGIFVNLATIERGRKFLVEDKVYKRFIPYIVSFDEKLRESTLKVLRNCAFEWEDEAFSTEILKADHNMLNLLGKLMAFLLSHKELISDPLLIESLVKKYFTEQELSSWEHSFKCVDKVKALSEVELAIDIVLILSNADLKAKAEGVDKEAFKRLLTALKYTKIQEETKDKLEALEIFGF